MPGGDRTGPVGNGPFTGRGLGYCAGNQVSFGPIYGRGIGNRRGLARGFGRGYRHYPYAVSSPFYYDEAEPSRESKVDYLKQTAKALEDELNDIKGQIGRLEDNNTE